MLLSGRPRFAGWSGADASDWWSAAIQFVGTLFFNVSTFAAIFDLPLLGEVKHVWRPDVYGSAAFLVSSVLAVVACTDRDRLWDPEARRAIKGRGVFRACRVKRAPEVLRAKLVRKDFGEFKARREFAEMLGLRASKECRARLVQWVRQA